MRDPSMAVPEEVSVLIIKYGIAALQCHLHGNQKVIISLSGAPISLLAYMFYVPVAKVSDFKATINFPNGLQIIVRTKN